MNAITPMLFGLFLLLNSSVAHADESPAISQEQVYAVPNSFNLWINPGLISYHYDRDAGYRNFNYGFGVQSDLSDQLSLMAGRFINSEHARSNFAGLAWQPLSWHSSKIGFAAGILDGYPTVNHGGKFPAVLPWISIRNERIGVNLTVVPYANDTLIAGQVILRVW